MARETTFHEVVLGGLVRQLPRFAVADGLEIAVFNILGDTEVIEIAAKELATRIPGTDVETLVTAETKSIPLVYELARQIGRPWVVLRKTYKPYMGAVVSATTRSITTAAEQTLHLDEKDRELVRGRNVLLVDDVVSTGSTVDGMRAVMAEVGAKIVGTAAVFTEGDEEPDDVIALGDLPLFPVGTP